VYVVVPNAKKFSSNGVPAVSFVIIYCRANIDFICSVPVQQKVSFNGTANLKYQPNGRSACRSERIVVVVLSFYISECGFPLAMDKIKILYA
jgi:hypothetical protein